MLTEFSPAEMEAALYRAFVEHHADYIVIDSRRQVFQIASASYGIDRGWLEGEWDNHDEQCSQWIVRLTDKGRGHFGLANLEERAR